MKIRKLFVAIGIIFLVVVVCCTVYSITVYQWNLPKVYIAAAEIGTFSYSHEARGTVSAFDKEKYKSDFTNSIILTLPSSVNYMYNGDEVEVQLSAQRASSKKKGEILSIIYEPDSVIMEIGFNAEGLNGGETVDVYISKESAIMNCILPKSALYEDYKGQYIFLVRKQKGAWGNDYVLERKDVNNLIYTETQVSISIESLKYPVVVGSDEPVFDGQVVRFYP